MKLEPLGYIGKESVAALQGGESQVTGTICNPRHFRDDVALYAIPEGHVVVPVEPTEAQWGELARDIMFVLRQERPTPRKLLYHLEHLHETLPDWLRNESEMQNLDHVISKGTCCVLIYKAMIAAKDGAANVAAYTRKPVVNGYLLEACPKCGCFGSESPCAVCKLRAASVKEQS